MARVLVLCGDLMFGSRIAAQLQGSGEELELLADPASVSERLRGPAQERPRVLVVDLTSGSEEGIALVAGLLGKGRDAAPGGPAGRERSPHARLLLPRRGGRARARRGRRIRPGRPPLAHGSRGGVAGGATAGRFHAPAG